MLNVVLNVIFSDTEGVLPWFSGCGLRCARSSCRVPVLVVAACDHRAHMVAESGFKTLGILISIKSNL